MKKLTLLMVPILFFAENIKAQTQFQINGRIEQDSLNKKEITLLTQTNEISDTIKIINNTFIFTGTISEPTNAAIIIDGTMLKFPLTNDKINFNIVSLNKKDFNISYSSSQIDSNLKLYFKEAKIYYDKYKELISQEIQTDIDQTKMNIQSQQDSLSQNFLTNLILKYSKSKNREGLSIMVFDLKLLFGTRNYPEKIKELYVLLPIEQQNGFYGKAINSYLNQSAQLALGEKIDLEFETLNSGKDSISAYRGKLVLLEFWATWCGPCIAQLPELKKLENSDKIQIISISIDDNIDKWKNTVPKLDMNWVNIHYKQKVNLKDKFFVSGVPYNVLLSQEGKILRKNVQISELLKIVE